MKKKSEKTIYEIIMFLLILSLVISLIFTADRLFFQKPTEECFMLHQDSFKEEECVYDLELISQCYKKNGNIIYKDNCLIECDDCYSQHLKELQKYENKVNLFRMILAFVIAISFTFINLKDKIIRYSILTASLISLFVATLMAMRLIGVILPIIIILEFILVIYIYKKIK